MLLIDIMLVWNLGGWRCATRGAGVQFIQGPFGRAQRVVVQLHHSCARPRQHPVPAAGGGMVQASAPRSVLAHDRVVQRRYRQPRGRSTSSG